MTDSDIGQWIHNDEGLKLMFDSWKANNKKGKKKDFISERREELVRIIKEISYAPAGAETPNKNQRTSLTSNHARL